MRACMQREAAAAATGGGGVGGIIRKIYVVEV